MSHDPPRQFSIPHPGWLLLAGFVLAAFAVALIVWNQPTLRVIRTVEQLGGSVQIEPVGPPWLRDLVGEKNMRAFDRLVWVDLENTAITDAGLTHLSSLSNLRRLYLNDTHVSDACLKHLRGLTNLKALSLDNTQVTDAGMMHLSSLTELWRLELNDTRVSAAGLKKLRQALPDVELLTRETTVKP